MSFHSWTCLFSHYKHSKFLLGVGIFISLVKSRCISKIHALYIWIHLISMFYIPSLSFHRWALIYCHCLQREEKWTCWVSPTCWQPFAHLNGLCAKACIQGSCFLNVAMCSPRKSDCGAGVKLGAVQEVCSLAALVPGDPHHPSVLLNICDKSAIW